MICSGILAVVGVLRRHLCAFAGREYAPLSSHGPSLLGQLWSGGLALRRMYAIGGML